MLKYIFALVALLILSGCNEDKPLIKYDGKALLESKCASCHDSHIPPHISDDELAPPMMAISFHIDRFMTPSDESQRTYKAIEFVVDYVLYPSLEKSFCDKDSLDRYGLMPSQKDNLTKGEAQAIAEYMFHHFTQENLSKIQKAQAKYDALSAGERVAIKHRCLGCHRVYKKIVGPSFEDIAKKLGSKESLKMAIKSGSKGNWSESNGAVMPPFKLDDKELEIVSEWIIKLSTSLE